MIYVHIYTYTHHSRAFVGGFEGSTVHDLAAVVLRMPNFDTSEQLQLSKELLNAAHLDGYRIHLFQATEASKFIAITRPLPVPPSLPPSQRGPAS